METTKLKRFATEARINLMEGVKRKLRLLGFDERGHAVSEPQLVQGATLWKGEEFPEDFYNQWKTLQQRLSEKGLREVAEEAAYTWFNRMMAIRILSMNGFCEPILRIDPSTGLPNLLANARMGRIPEMSAQQRHRLDILMDDDTKSYEQFALLLTAWCHDNPIINACFGSINDYVELLLPDNILRPDGFLALLNETEFISEEDYKSAELIGWLYQFYISDRKDEVFSKKGKVEADEIPAATQIFTPNWIVKYMVQNTILPQVEAPEEIIEKAKYLVKVEGADNRKVELEDLKVADFACGSGHILNECFDLLFELYRAEAYSRKEAVEYIFTKNLTGIDIDLRAKQLATFALLLKACQKDESFIDAHCLPHVITIPSLDSVYFNGEEIDAKEFIHHFFKGTETKECAEQLNEAIKLVAKADSLGSIIKFNLSSSTRRQLVETVNHWKINEEQSDALKKHLRVFDFIITLTDNYDAIVMNPPYMPTNKIEDIRNYTLSNYFHYHIDLFAVFMKVAENRLTFNGKYGILNMQSWAFLSSYEDLRLEILKNNQIDSLIHLGSHTFDELNGEIVQNVAYIFTKGKREKNSKAIFIKVDNGKDCTSKENLFFDISNHITVKDINIFINSPSYIFAYWLKEKSIEIFNNSLKLEEFAYARVGMFTGDNNRFLRNWWEVSANNFFIDCKNYKESISSDKKWYPYNKGGRGRRWYGNYELVVNYKNGGYEIYKLAKQEKRNCQDYPNEYKFIENITWSTAGADAFRKQNSGTLFDTKGMSMFTHTNKINYVLGYTNSKVGLHFLKALSPSTDTQVGQVRQLPIVYNPKVLKENFVVDCVKISREDWDSHETSWDFSTNELVENTKCQIKNRKYGIKDALKDYQEKWTGLFFQLHRNEEELNRQFIEIYGLQDELTPDVPLDEITILQQGEIKIKNPELRIKNLDGENLNSYLLNLNFQDDVLIKQLISYIVGVYMGRYRLDKPGLHIAYPEPSDSELSKYKIPNSKYKINDSQESVEEWLQIDPDAIIPVLPKDAPFYDNLYNYVVEFVGKVWGQEELTENLNFIEKSLRKSLEDYLLKDFWKDHKKMYQNRPIYWEFASKKGAFKAIIYAHRMDKYTIEVLRSKYVLPFIKHIENKISNLESREQELSTKERRELDNLRTKILPELEEYHSRVEQVAAETAARPQVFDLDDGIPHNHSLFGDIVTKLK